MGYNLDTSVSYQTFSAGQFLWQLKKISKKVRFDYLSCLFIPN